MPAATLSARQRRPRFPERALLERLRKYEDLLRDHDVEFEPMHKVSNAAPARLSGDRKYTIKSGNKEDGTDRNVSGNAREVK